MKLHMEKIDQPLKSESPRVDGGDLSESFAHSFTHPVTLFLFVGPLRFAKGPNKETHCFQELSARRERQPSRTDALYNGPCSRKEKHKVLQKQIARVVKG